MARDPIRQPIAGRRRARQAGPTPAGRQISRGMLIAAMARGRPVSSLISCGSGSAGCQTAIRHHRDPPGPPNRPKGSGLGRMPDGTPGKQPSGLVLLTCGTRRTSRTRPRPAREKVCPIREVRSRPSRKATARRTGDRGRAATPWQGSIRRLATRPRPTGRGSCRASLRRHGLPPLMLERPWRECLGDESAPAYRS